MTEDKPSAFTELLSKRAPDPQASSAIQRAKYDFAVAYPDPATLPLGELVEGLDEALKEEGRDLAVYPHPQGYPPLREFVAQKLARDRGINVDPDEIILADGSGQPIHMFTELLVEPGDVVLTEDYVYVGTLNTLHRFHAEVRGVLCDGYGIVPEALEEVLEAVRAEGKRTKFVYTIPTFQNPQGWTMTLERRKALVEICQRYEVAILEDDCYVDLRYDGEDVPSIHSLDDSGRVMYVGSFSKIIAPGMRMGYMTAAPEMVARARAVKSGGGVNQFTALAVHRYTTTGLADHIEEVKSVQRTKRDAMLAALGENFGSAATWSKPEGSLYVWLRMGEDVDMESAQPDAMAADVGFLPGQRFSADGASGKNYARLCYGYNTPQEIHEGVARLSEVLAKRGAL